MRGREKGSDSIFGLLLVVVDEGLDADSEGADDTADDGEVEDDFGGISAATEGAAKTMPLDVTAAWTGEARLAIARASRGEARVGRRFVSISSNRRCRGLRDDEGGKSRLRWGFPLKVTRAFSAVQVRFWELNKERSIEGSSGML